MLSWLVEREGGYRVIIFTFIRSRAEHCHWDQIMGTSSIMGLKLVNILCIMKSWRSEIHVLLVNCMAMQ